MLLSQLFDLLLQYFLEGLRAGELGPVFRRSGGPDRVVDRYVVRIEILSRLRKQLRVRGKAFELVQIIQVELA